MTDEPHKDVPPRIRDLPQEEQAPFALWLQGQSRPVLDAPRAEQDGYFITDYLRWKQNCQDA